MRRWLAVRSLRGVHLWKAAIIRAAKNLPAVRQSEHLSHRGVARTAESSEFRWKKAGRLIPLGAAGSLRSLRKNPNAPRPLEAFRARTHERAAIAIGALVISEVKHEAHRVALHCRIGCGHCPADTGGQRMVQHE
jgi:hypothetical protein